MHEFVLLPVTLQHVPQTQLISRINPILELDTLDHSLGLAQEDAVVLLVQLVPAEGHHVNLEWLEPSKRPDPAETLVQPHAIALLVLPGVVGPCFNLPGVKAEEGWIVHFLLGESVPESVHCLDDAARTLLLEGGDGL
jgi:hypothetical protein